MNNDYKCCTVNAVNPTASPRVYYVLARRLLSRNTGHNYRAENGLYVYNVKDAIQFNSIAAIFARFATGFTTDATMIVRVEETASAPRRELVTSGDLSLLDKGPVVIEYLPGHYVADRKGHATARSLDDAFLFRDMTDATRSLNGAHDGARIYFRIVPVREIPGTTITTETVLA